MEDLNATMNARALISLTIIFDADVAALHKAAKSMQNKASRHRAFDAQIKATPPRTHSADDASAHDDLRVANNTEAPEPIGEGGL